ncbi:hypothetical protein BDN70DRAFT_902219 [Pholiota conissans]|uniref:Uncharacterized protein n=1 Tax=Pholiota conissans TaxID=109636 RepID=A0A9P5YI41_9AGAR|nr:hypothetical protein BDN70DRAFT_902219 [Pholiota conissans]
MYVSGSLSPSSLTSFLILSPISGGKTPGHGRHAATDERITTVPRHWRWSTMDEQRTMTAACALEVDEDGRTRTDGRGWVDDDGRARNDMDKDGQGEGLRASSGRESEERVVRRGWTMTGSRGQGGDEEQVDKRGESGLARRWRTDERRAGWREGTLVRRGRMCGRARRRQTGERGEDESTGESPSSLLFFPLSPLPLCHPLPALALHIYWIIIHMYEL